MTLIVCQIAAIVSALLWYFKGRDKKWHLGLLAFMYFGASLMWFVDACFGFFGSEHKFLGIEQFSFDSTGNLIVDETNLQTAFYQGVEDARLGLLVVVAGLIVWTIAVLISDPRRVWRKDLSEKTIEK